MRVHYLPEGHLWVACGTPHDHLVNEDVAEVTCRSCQATNLFRRAAGDRAYALMVEGVEVETLTHAGPLIH
jgi:hypothetical protein